MLRLTVFGLVATFLSLVTAIPTESFGKSIEKRGSYKPKHYKHHKPHGYPPSSKSCPTGKPFYIQASANSNYGTISPNTFIGPDASNIVFNEATEELAVSQRAA